MLKVIPFEREHLSQIKVREPNLSFARGVESIEMFADIYECKGPAFSLFDGEEIIGAFGIVMGWRGIGEAWVYVSEGISKHKTEFHRIIKTLLNKVILDFKLRRVQASVDEHYEIGLQWARRLGFIEEGRMAGYGVNGETYVLMAKIKGGA